MVTKIPRFHPSFSTDSLGASFKLISSSAIDATVDGGNLFEKAFAEYIGAKHAIVVPSGRIGLYLILKNMGLPAGSEILVPALTYWAVVQVIMSLKLKPIFIDIDPQSYHMDFGLIEHKISRRTKAALPTHLYGLPCAMDTMMEIAAKRQLLVIEDCVQACGAAFNGRKAGSFGDASYFSFGLTKSFSLLDGGAIVTDNDTLASKIKKEVMSFSFLEKRAMASRYAKMLAMKALTQRYVFSFSLFFPIILFSLFGIDLVDAFFSEKENRSEKIPERYFRLLPDAFINQIGTEELRRIDTCIQQRRQNGRFLLKELSVHNSVSLPLERNNIFTTFPIRSKKRDWLSKELLKRGIDSSKGYMKALGNDCPVAREIVATILHIPIYPSLKERQLLYIASAIDEICAKGS